MAVPVSAEAGTANVIERQFKKANDWPFGSALSLFLLYVTFIILAARSIYDATRKTRGTE